MSDFGFHWLIVWNMLQGAREARPSLMQERVFAFFVDEIDLDCG